MDELNELKVLYFEPGKKNPEIKVIEDTLSEKQKLVGGYIEPLYLDCGCVCICNEEGLCNGMPVNRLVYPSGKGSGEPAGIFGPFFVMMDDWTSYDEKVDLSGYIRSRDETFEYIRKILARKNAGR